MSIEHLESLPIDEFIQIIDNIHQYRITEKLDGMNMIFGLDDQGQLYTSRENKGGDRVYNWEDYSLIPTSNGVKRAMHQALHNIQDTLRRVMQAGDQIEAEVLYGRQPNAIVYGANYIVPLRALQGKPDFSILTVPPIIVTVPVSTTADGLELTTTTERQAWRFVQIPIIDAKIPQIDTQPLKTWLEQKNHLNITNRDTLAINLNRFPKDQREKLRNMRNITQKHLMYAFTLPIKHQLSTILLHNVQSKLLTCKLKQHEDIGIEGVVLYNPITQHQVKIVDRDTFSIINQFNFVVRNLILGSNKTETFGINLGKSNIVRNFMITTQTHFNAYTTPCPMIVQEILTDTIYAIKDALRVYNRDWPTYTLKFRGNRQIGYSEAIHNRTLLSFAEILNSLHELARDFCKLPTKDVMIGLIQDKFGRSVFR